MEAPTILRLVAILIVTATAARADTDIKIPLGDHGHLYVRADFIRREGNVFYPNLMFKMLNSTDAPWTVTLRFSIGGLCNGEIRIWTIPATVTMGTQSAMAEPVQHVETPIALIGKIDGCNSEIIKADLAYAINLKDHSQIEGTLDGHSEIYAEMARIKAKRDEEAALAEKAATEEARQIAEAKVAQERAFAIAEAKRQKEIAEAAAKQEAERKRAKALCSAVYRETIDKKVSELTVRQEQQVRTCQALGMYSQ